MDGDDIFDKSRLFDGMDIVIFEFVEVVLKLIIFLKLFGFNFENLIGSNVFIVGFGLNGLGSIGYNYMRDKLCWGVENVIDLVGYVDLYFDVVF